MGLHPIVVVGLLGSGFYTLVAILLMLVVVPLILIVRIATAQAYLQDDADAFIEELEED